ncbi:hypothetical protein MMC28_005372 [Mycoblastus sanguinarius]|nr:hypothetical protein [Mycoblastus sanguinarius]
MAKTQEISRCLEILGPDTEKKNLSSKGKNFSDPGMKKWNLTEQSIARLETLSLLKSQITTTESAALFDSNDIKTICYYAFEGFDAHCEASELALKCLANILLLEPKARQIFANDGHARQTASRLRTDELLCSRILFLLTYDTVYNFDDLFKNKSLAESIRENVAAHASKFPSKSQSEGLQPMEVQALSETLKLLFNLTTYYPHHIPEFIDTLPNVLHILLEVPLKALALQPPVTWLINALLNLNGETTSAFPSSSSSPLLSHIYPASDPNIHIDRLTIILSSTVRTIKEEQLETTLTPLITLLRRLYELAPAPIKSHMQSTLLPSDDERAQPLGKSDSLPSYLLRLSTSPVAQQLREGVSSLLFELSSKNATTFVRNVGYGFAAGFLMTHNLPMPSGEDLGEKITIVGGREINPITGQMKDMEPRDNGPEMTDEEKEREAERLFVLFERLKATGVMEVVNPVEQAAREGRFEEVE